MPEKCLNCWVKHENKCFFNYKVDDPECKLYSMDLRELDKKVKSILNKTQK